MPKDFLTDQLKQWFTGYKSITRDQLFDFYRRQEPFLNESTFGWRIYALKEKNILRPIKQGIYTLSVKPAFHPIPEPRLQEISNRILKQFPKIRYCVWNTRWVNEWMVHQPGRFLFIIEAETAITESVFYYLKDSNYRNVFLNPDGSMLERYVYDQSESIIVKTLVTKAPLKKEKKIPVPVLEKILVDLFVDKKLFSPFQGEELENIFNNAYAKYTLNITKLLAYSRRRAKEEELIDFMTRQTALNELLSE